MMRCQQMPYKGKIKMKKGRGRKGKGEGEKQSKYRLSQQRPEYNLEEMKIIDPKASPPKNIQ